MQVAWRRRALADVSRIARYIAQDNPVAAARVTRALTTAADSLARLPEKGRPGLVLGTRELSAVPPYVIVYRVEREAQTITILRIWHTAQDR